MTKHARGGFEHTVDPGLYYDRMGAKFYDILTSVCNWRGPEEMAAILEPLNLSGAVVADIGIGPGTLSAAFRRAGVRTIIGVDSAPSLLDHCTKEGLADELHLCDAGAETLPIAEDSVDLAVASGVMAYVNSPRMLAWNMAQITKAGGHMAVNFHPSERPSLERLTAGSIMKAEGAIVNVFHYPESDIVDAFARVGANVVARRRMDEGILRVGDGIRALPLTTLLLQKI